MKISIASALIIFSSLFAAYLTPALGEETPSSALSEPINAKILISDLARTDLNLALLGTMNRGGAGKAILKNLNSGILRIYGEGETIDIVSEETVTLVRTDDCLAIIERRGRYETLGCDGGTFNGAVASYKIPTPLAKYKITQAPAKPKQPKAVKLKSDYDKEIALASEKHGVDRYLVKAVIKAESNFNPDAVSPKNAQGIMQLMPETSKDYGVEDPFNPMENIDGGVRLLRDLMSYFKGDLGLALAAYNAGKGTVIKYGNKVPPYPETENYVKKVEGYYDFLRKNK
ncbi:MAG: transglycosylase SLT domain-containing protein [Deltaproteobacteria bacterium]